MQNDVLVCELDIRRLFLGSSAKGLKFHCVHLKSQFKTYMYKHDFDWIKFGSQLCKFHKCDVET